MTISLNSIPPSRDRSSEEGSSPVRKSVDLKVLGLVLERISRAKGGLLPSATAPQVVIDLLPAFELAKMGHAFQGKRKGKLRKTPLIQRAPIGLRPVDPEGWINALMQLILSIPGFAELFLFSPRSFYPFREFIDQYHQDQQDNYSISSADGVALFRFLSLRLSVPCLHESFRFLLRVLHSKWEIRKDLEEALKKERPVDLFVTESSLKKQFFTEPDLFCYDLGAFIELRPDGPAMNFIAYVKVAGAWYQCDDDRITLLRSNSLNAPLHRAVLLHYKRIDFCKNNRI